MKATVFFLIVGFVFTMSSCSNDTQDVNIADTLYVTGDDIVSFNITTKEIVFTDLASERLADRDLGLFSILTICFNENHLYESVRIMPPISSISWVGFVVLELRSRGFDELLNKHDYQFFLIDKRDSTSKTKKEWDIFIKYLSDAGKIVE